MADVRIGDIRETGTICAICNLPKCLSANYIRLGLPSFRLLRGRYNNERNHLTTVIRLVISKSALLIIIIGSTVLFKTFLTELITSDMLISTNSHVYQ